LDKASCRKEETIIYYRSYNCIIGCYSHRYKPSTRAMGHNTIFWQERPILYSHV